MKPEDQTPTSPSPVTSDKQAEATSSEQLSSENPAPRRSWLAAVVAVIILASAVTAGVTLQKHHDRLTKAAQKTAQQQSNNPAHLSGIAVNTFPYVSACKVLTSQNQQDLFAGISQSALIMARYAEDGLPVKDIPAGGIESSCFRSFGSDTPYANTTMTFKITQYPTAAAAKKQYSTYTVTQAELDKGNARFGTGLTTDYAPLSGVENAVYSNQNHNAYILVDNKILSFSALLGDISDDTFMQAVTKALPVVTANARSQKPAQDLPTDPAFGKTIGASTIMNPCTFFSAADFQKGIGGKSDPTNVQIQFNYGSDQYFPSDTHDGWADSSCSRASYPGSTTHVQNVTVELHYYKTAEEAALNVKQNVQKRVDDPFYQQSVQNVSGVGDYAAYTTPTGTSKLSYFYVQKGSYVLIAHTNIVNTGDTAAVNGRPAQTDSHKYPTSDEYKKLVNVLLPKLK